MERKFEIVLFAENGRTETKSSADESWRTNLPSTPKFVMIRAKLRERWSFEIVPCDPPGIGAKKVQESSKTSFELLTQSTELLSKVLS